MGVHLGLVRRVVMFVHPVFAIVPVGMLVDIAVVRVGMPVLVNVLVGMGMAVTVSVRDIGVPVLMIVLVHMVMRVQVLVFVVSFHLRRLLAENARSCHQGVVLQGATPLTF